jgi:hypothetical protein
MRRSIAIAGPRANATDPEDRAGATASVFAERTPSCTINA